MQTLNTVWKAQSTLFELIDEPWHENQELPFAEEAAQIVYDLGSMAMRFARVERVPRYDEHSRENDAEHSFMLALVAPELAATYYSELDVGLVAQFSTVHDLIELETADVATLLSTTVHLQPKSWQNIQHLKNLAHRCQHTLGACYCATNYKWSQSHVLFGWSIKRCH